jgi:hypothetical protein
LGPKLETKENRHKYEAVLKGVATLCSERPKESKKEDLGEEPAEAQPQEPKTIRKRYSGAARRRHKKQQQREAGERAVHLVPSRPMQLLSHLDLGSRVHQGQLNARDWTRAYPVLQEYNKQKKPKVPELNTYAQVAAGISRVAIVPMAYPDRKFDALLKGSV